MPFRDKIKILNKNRPPINEQPPQSISYRSWGIILIVVLTTAALRIRLLEVPLERDEGGYAYTAQLILQGIPPFAQAYDMKMPGLYAVYVLILVIFGQTLAGIHLGLLVINAATIVLLFFLGRRLLDTTAGLMASASYAVMSLSQYVQGFSANAEHLLLLPVLGGILLMLRAIESGRLRTFFGAGLLLGLALAIKHHSMFFIAFAALYLFFSYFSRPANRWMRYLLEYTLFALGAIIPFGLLCLGFLYLGLFDKFWFWLFEYLREYSSLIPFSAGLDILKLRVSGMAQASIPLWILAGIGLTALVWNRNTRKRSLFFSSFLLFSLLPIVPGYRFFPHYFVLILPPVALLTGAAVSSIAALLAGYKSPVIRKILPNLLAAGAILYPLLVERAYLFRLSPNEISRAAYGEGFPFPESMEIANYIKKHTLADDCIGILGSEPQICFYARRRSASAHIYVYPLMGKHKYARAMQLEMIQQIESARPKFLVFVNMQTSWTVQPGSETLIFEWFRHYTRRHYRKVGVIDIISRDLTVYRWDDTAVGYAPRSKRYILVFKRETKV